MSSSTINPAALLTMIATMENQLNQMKVLLGAEGGIVAVTKKATKAKKEKDPNAAPKEPNVWIKFTQRISALLKGADIDVGAAPISKQFASTLKDEKPYAEWTDEAILAAWPLWTKPEQSKMAVAKAASSDEASVASGEKAAAKRAPMSDEAKEKTAAKRAAAKAAKAEPKAEEAKPKAEEVKAVTVEAKEPAKKTGKAIRLPTEAEWENACRAGANTKFFWGDDESKLGDYVWYRENMDGKMHAVGQKKPNAWGLYDINGLMWEYCRIGEVAPKADAKETFKDFATRGATWGSRPPMFVLGVRMPVGETKPASQPASRPAGPDRYGMRVAMDAE